MKDYIYEENGKWCYDEWLEPESRGWVTHSFDTKEQAEAHRDERENAGLAKMAGEQFTPNGVYLKFKQVDFSIVVELATEKDGFLYVPAHTKRQGGEVERVDGLTEAFAVLEEKPAYFIQACKAFVEKYKCMPQVKFQEAARIQLKRQGE